jgi:hypothetical protein
MQPQESRCETRKFGSGNGGQYRSGLRQAASFGNQNVYTLRKRQPRRIWRGQAGTMED